MVRNAPILVNYYERAQEDRNENLEIPELLQKDQGSHKDQNSHLTEKRFVESSTALFVIQVLIHNSISLFESFLIQTVFVLPEEE